MLVVLLIYSRVPCIATPLHVFRMVYNVYYMIHLGVDNDHHFLIGWIHDETYMDTPPQTVLVP